MSRRFRDHCVKKVFPFSNDDFCAPTVSPLSVITLVYLSLVEWKNKQELEKSDKKIASTGVLPPEISPEGSSPGGSGAEEEGNRLYRRRVKKEKQKEKS